MQRYAVAQGLEVSRGEVLQHKVIHEINAKIDASEFASLKMTNAEQRKRVSLVEQSLLADRFKLKVHYETREVPVHALVLANSGSKMTAAGESEASRLGSSRGLTGNELTATAVTMADLVNYPPLWPGRPIVDQTGLQGKFSFTLKWSSGGASEMGAESPSVFSAVQEQLGLRLVPTKGTVEVIVIDHIERPTEIDGSPAARPALKIVGAPLLVTRPPGLNSLAIDNTSVKRGSRQL